MNGCLIHPAAVAGEISSLGSLPGAGSFLDREDPAAPAKVAAALDHRYQRPSVRVVKSWNSQETHISKAFVVFAWFAITLVCGQAHQRLVEIALR